jgi:hypothetical protein
MALASPAITRYVDAPDREVTIAIGSAIAGGFLTALAVLEADPASWTRRDEADEAHERILRARHVTE